MDKSRLGGARAGLIAGFLLAAGCRGPALSTHAGAPSAADLTPRSAIMVETATVAFGGVVVRAGDPVRIHKRAGTFKPSDTGHDMEVEAETGRTGVALGGVRREGFGPEPIQQVLVQFDPQVWREWPGLSNEASLGPFEATIHIEHLEVVRP